LHVLAAGSTTQISPSLGGQGPIQHNESLDPGHWTMCPCQMAYKSVEWFKQGARMSLGIPVYSDHAIAAYFAYFSKMHIFSSI